VRLPRGAARRLAVAAARLAGVVVLGLALGSPARIGRAQAAVDVDSELDARLEALEAEREAIRTTGLIVGVGIGAALFSLGASQIVSIQYNCPGYYDCSDETRWGLTAGAGAAIVVGGVTAALTVPPLTRRLKARRELTEEINALRIERSDRAEHAAAGRRAATAAAGARAPRPAWSLGLGLAGGRRDVRLTIVY